MTAMHYMFARSTVTIAALLVAACHPLAVESIISTSGPTPFSAPEREPLQAGLYDFAFAFAEFDGDGTDPKLYAAAILKIQDCMEDELFAETSESYTSGQKAALHWIGLSMLIGQHASEDSEEPGAPHLLSLLTELQEYCMADP